jgi:TolB-like protein
MRYKNGEKSIAQVRDELNVDYVLEGSVRRGERGLRITAQLITAADRDAPLGRQLRSPVCRCSGDPA